MLAIIAPAQSVSAVLAAANDCCSLPQQQPQQQARQDPPPQPAPAPASPRDAVTTQQAAVQQQPLTSSKQQPKQQQMGAQNDQGAAAASTTASTTPGAAAAADGGAGGAADLEPNTSSSSSSATNGTTAPAAPAPTRSERRKSERRPSRGERKAAAPVAGYSTDSYWNSRYAERSTHFDWFYNYTALAELINITCDSQAGPCLHVGCGNSGFSEGMVQDGFQVVNVDISPVVIEQMRTMDQFPGQKWEVADCRSMPQYQGGSFGSVLDKGTLDAVLCSSHGTADAASYLDEVHRLLAPGGVFLLVSLGQPHARLTALRALPAAATPHSNPMPYLSADLQQRAAASNAAAAGAAAAAAAATALDATAASVPQQQAWEWESVEVYLLPKPSLYMQSEASLTGKPIVAHMRHSDKDMPVEMLGPFTPGDELDAFIAQEHLDMREFFTAFACTKPAGAAAAADAEAAAPEPAAPAAPAPAGEEAAAAAVADS